MLHLPANWPVNRLIPIMLVLAVPVRADQWTGFRGPNGDGVSAQKLDLLEEPAKLWQVSVGEGNASMVVRDERLYTIGWVRDRGATLTCLNTADGKVLWSKQYETGCMDTTPVLDGDQLLVLCHLNPPRLRSFDATTGEAGWDTALPAPAGERHYGHASSPRVHGDIVLVNAGYGAALNRRNGKVLWRHDGLPGLATPVVYKAGERDAAAFFAGDALIGRDLDSGEQLWSIPWKTSLAVNACDPIVFEGKAYLCTTYGKYAALFDLTATPPRELWREQGASFSSGFRHGEHLYCFADPDFVCLDAKSGERKWTFPGVSKGSAILIDSKIVLISEYGELIIAPVSPQHFKPAFRQHVLGGTNWTPPAYADGKLFLRNKDGQIACVKIGK